MATSKRARQRANREARRVVEKKQQRRDRTLGRAKRYAIWGVAIVAVFLVANAVWGGSDDGQAPAETTTPTTAVSTTQPGTTRPETTTTG